MNELDYLKRLLDLNIDCNFKVHLQIDTGFNRLGFKDKNEVKIAVDMINGSNFVLEGIYQHFATAGIFDPHWDEQVRNFKELTSLIDLNKIPIVHMGSSVSMLTHPKQPFTTGVRMGIAIYGYNVAPDSLSNSPKDKLRKMRNNYFIKKYNISETYFDVKIDLQPAMKMKTRILQLKKVNKVSGSATMRHTRQMRILFLQFFLSATTTASVTQITTDRLLSTAKNILLSVRCV